MSDELVGGPRKLHRSAVKRLPYRRRRVLAAVAGALALIAGLVVADLDKTVVSGGDSVTDGTAVALEGRVAALAAGGQWVYALVDPCPGRAEGCTPVLASSEDEGVHWVRRSLPGGQPPMTARSSWQLTVLPDGRPVLEIGTTLHVGTADGAGYTSRPERAGPAVAGVPLGPADPRDPAGATSRLPAASVRLCPATACARPIVQYLDAGTGHLSALKQQPPLNPAAVAVGGSSIWAAGIDLRSRGYAAAVSPDGGRTWQRIALPEASTDNELTPILRPGARGDWAYLLFAYSPLERGQRPIYDVWTLATPDPGPGNKPGAAPRRVWPESTMSAADAVALDNGLLLCSDSGSSFTLSPTGVVDGPDTNPGRNPVAVRSLLRGQHGHIFGTIVGDVAAIAVSAAGTPARWPIRPIIVA